MAWQALLKAAAEYCEHGKRRKECKLCSDEFRLILLKNLDMLLMVEKGIRGGITKVVNCYARANYKYIKGLQNLDELSIYLQYVDANNLYRSAMINNLPTHGFKMEEERRL